MSPGPAMPSRALGASGLRVSALALGSWRTFAVGLNYGEAEAVVRAALDAGITLIDTADVYAGGQAEAWLGWILEGSRRQDVVLCTKAYWPVGPGPNDRGLSRKHVTESVTGSLARLRTDRIDLFLCHRWDAGTPLRETVACLGDLIRRGLLLHWGASCWSPAQLAAACAEADAQGVPRPIAHQPRYNLLDRAIEAEVVPASARLGIGQIAFSPLAQGALTGKYLDGTPSGSRGADPSRGDGLVAGKSRRAQLEAFVTLARETGVAPATLALAWCLGRPGVDSVLFGASTPAQVRENVAAVGALIGRGLATKLDALFPAAVGERVHR